MSFTSFDSDIKKGKIKEFIFKNFFLNFLGIANKDVSNDPNYQRSDIDILTSDFSCDVKSLSFKDSIIVEEYTNIAPELSPISKGWFYKSSANLIAFVSYNDKNKNQNNGLIIVLRFDSKFKKWYEHNKERYDLKRNKVSENKRGQRWQSAYRVVPFTDLEGFIASYKVKIVQDNNIFEITYPDKPLITIPKLF